MPLQWRNQFWKSLEEGCREARLRVWDYQGNVMVKLQALVYDIIPSITAVFSYAIGCRKLSANEQFFVGAQTVVLCYKQLK